MAECVDLNQRRDIMINKLLAASLISIFLTGCVVAPTPVGVVQPDIVIVPIWYNGEWLYRDRMGFYYHYDGGGRYHRFEHHR